MLDWPGNDRKMTSDSNFKERFSKNYLDLVRGFSLNLMQFEKCSHQWSASVCKFNIIKQGMLDWPGNDGKNFATNELATKRF